MRSVYIHIPFCSDICNYCDFCKVYYDSDVVSRYLDALEFEIAKRYNGEVVSTLYIGGGTPSVLSISELERLFQIISRFNLDSFLEFTFECNVDSLSYDKMLFLFNHGVNRISLGVQTFNDKFLKFLNRGHCSADVVRVVDDLKRVGFRNISVDLMYAFPGESVSDVSSDLDFLLRLDIPHVSTYSLMIEPHTKFFVDGVLSIDEDLDYEMYRLICDRLRDNGYKHYEVSNFSREGFCSRHNLTYWNNFNYYGFGCGASGYIGNVRYDNTRSLNRYLAHDFLWHEDVLSKSDIILNEFILGFRKLDGINISSFSQKYGDIFKYDVINRLILEGKLINDGCNIYINPSYVYISNTILVDFIGEVYE